MSNPTIEQITQGPSIALVVQDRRSVKRDLLVNGKRARRSLLLLISYCFLSAALTLAAESGQTCDHCFKGTLLEKFGDAIYYTWINVTTVGFGDFSPQTIGGKVVAVLNAIFGLVLIGWIVAILTTSLIPSDGAAEDPKVPENAGRRFRTSRWLAKKFRGFGHWISGRAGPTRLASGTFFNATVRDAEVAKLSEDLAAAQAEAAHLKDALVRERGIVDDLVLGRDDRGFRPGGQRALDDLNFYIRDFLLRFRLSGVDGMSWPVFREEVRCVSEQNAVIVMLHPIEPDLSEESNTDPSSEKVLNENPDESLREANNQACRRLAEDERRLEGWTRMRAHASSPGENRIFDQAISLSKARLKQSDVEAREAGKRLAEWSAERLGSVFPAASPTPRDGGGRL